MKKFVRTKTFWISAAALAMVGAVSIPSAMAYFTTYATAKGGYEIEITGTRTEVEEDVVDMTKRISIVNNGEVPCYVRVKVLAGDMIKDLLTYTNAAEQGSLAGTWVNDPDGYWYFMKEDGKTPAIVDPGEFTSRLDAAIGNLPEDFDRDFDIVVIQECTPVLYDESGNPIADWNMKADVVDTVKGGD